MLLVYDIFLLGVIFITLMICLILIIKGKKKNKSNFFLAAALFIISWYSMIYLLISTGLMLKWSFLFGWGISIYYLVPPLCYWYAVSTFKPEWKFKKIDLLHLIPAFIGLIDAIPIIISEEKHIMIQAIIDDFDHIHLHNTTWIIPQKFHFIIRPVHGLIYLTVIWFLLIPPFIKNRSSFKRKQNKSNHWLLIFTFLITVMYLTLAVSTVIGMTNVFRHNELLETIKLPLFLLAISFFALGIYLFFNPSILYGFEDRPPSPLPSSPNKAESIDKKGENISIEQIDSYVKILEKYMIEEFPYRRQGISINDVASETGIPARTLSFILNNHYNLRFTDFINKYRISYITQKLDEGYWKQITLEGLALEAGFSSRSTFFSAFKKILGKSPSQYLERLQQQNKDSNH